MITNGINEIRGDVMKATVPKHINICNPTMYTTFQKNISTDNGLDVIAIQNFESELHKSHF